MPNPRQTAAPTAPTVNPNPFLSLFPLSSVVFRPPQGNRKPSVWSDGTISHTLAETTIGMRDFTDPDPNATIDGAYLRGARVVLLIAPNGAKRMDVQMPSSGTKFHFPFIDFSGDGAFESKASYEAWRKAWAEQFIVWRKAVVAAGGSQIGASELTQGFGIDADALAALNIDADAIVQATKPVATT